ncbi:FH2 domain-containing protein 1-like [Morone saxatilis]|uniref:FH2 domain-containing protein 1-like n=1 Tax=Morone saxatilis TaxID=34816 RepID=UPI0015E21076|nr:FH2 domain-containing protein 1-like [Morone saxatilis]
MGQRLHGHETGRPFLPQRRGPATRDGQPYETSYPPAPPRPPPPSNKQSSASSSSSSSSSSIRPCWYRGMNPLAMALKKKKRSEAVKGRANLLETQRPGAASKYQIRTSGNIDGDCLVRTDCYIKRQSRPHGTERSSLRREPKEEILAVNTTLTQAQRAHMNAGGIPPTGKRNRARLTVMKLTSYRGDVSKLSLADSFVYLLSQLPSYLVRIESMLLKEEFPAASEVMRRDIKILRTATKELMCCEELHAVLHLVLQAGNILNAKPGMNLLHFVALEAQKKDVNLLEFPLKLRHVHPAARISVATLDTELQCLTTRTRSVEVSAQRDTELLQQLDDFLQSATSSLCSLQGSRQQLKQEGSELIDFFCEDRETFRLDDCFSIFHTFCSRFTAAVKDNVEREVKDAARLRRLQELEEQKRHSWAGGELVGGAFRLRCSSEADMSAAISRHDEAGLLMELLTPKTRPRSPLNNNPLGRSESLRRSRNSPSSSPSIAAERELSTLLGMATHDHKDAPLSAHEHGRRSPGLSPQSPRATTCSFPQNQQPQAGQTVPQTRSSSANHTTATYLSFDATQTRLTAIDPINKVTVAPTSDANQQSDLNNNGKDRLGLGFTSQGTLSERHSGLSGEQTRTNKADQDSRGSIDRSDDTFERGAATAGNMSVVLEKCTLVPELKVFDKVSGHGEERHRTRGHPGDDISIIDLEEDGVDEVQNVEKSNAQIPETNTSSSQEEEEEGREQKVVVWCVTGVCEAAGELAHSDETHAQTEKDQSRTDNQGGSRQASSSPTNRTPSEPQPANEKPVPVPISSQPVPVSRCDDPSHPASSPRWRPAEPTSANEGPILTAGASEEETANQEEEAEGSTNEEREPKTEASTNDKAEPVASTKPSTKNLLTSKPRPAGMKPASSNKGKPVRTLNCSEDQGMRRVVPISRTSRGAPSLGKHSEKASGGNRRGSSSTPVPVGLTVSSHSSPSLRRGERPSTAPSSRRSSITKDPKDQKVSGPSAREQNQDLHRKPSIRKPLTKPKVQPEEKMCRSTLRALTQGGGGGGGSVSAPVTPLHKAATPSSSLLPRFARSTASSSFRRTHVTLAPRPHSPHTASNSSPKTTTSSSSPVPPPSSSSPLKRTGSLRSPVTSRSSDLVNPSFSSSSSSALTKSQSIRAPPHDSLAPPKGHRRNDSGSFSDKSSHSRDSGKPSRPNWR